MLTQETMERLKLNEEFNAEFFAEMTCPIDLAQYQYYHGMDRTANPFPVDTTASFQWLAEYTRLVDEWTLSAINA